MLKRVLIGFAVLFAIVTFIFYYKLGGNQPLEFNIASHPEFYIVGEYFEGRYNDPKAEKLFFDAKARAERNENYTLTIINYPSREKGKIIRQFIGNAVPEKPLDSIESLEIKKVPRQEVVFTTINSHNFVMPTPEEVHNHALEFAHEKGYNLDSLTYESYISARELKIIFPVKQ